MSQKGLPVRQAGLAPILIVIIIATLIGGYFIYQNQATPKKTITLEVQVAYNTVKLHSGKNSFELEILIPDGSTRPTKATVYDVAGKILKTYTVDGPWSSLCFDNQKVYKAIGTMEEIPGFKSVEISLLDNKRATLVVQKELGEHCRPGTISIE